MKTTSLCGNPNCGGCPSIKEEEGKNEGITIIDKNQEIVFTEEQTQKLTKYLNER